MSSPQSSVVFALDLPTPEQAAAAARQVREAVGMVKVGLELFVSAGPRAVQVVRDVGVPVFLDLKLHDIPETVDRAVAQAAELGVRALTVHASGGPAMLRRAVERAGSAVSICAVTILTSLDDADLEAVGVAAPASEAALRLATMAWGCGVRWFVSSPAEVKALRGALGPDAVLVTPGVRPSDTAAGDQKRVATPEQAARDGADWVVVGRPIRDAADPAARAHAIAQAVREART